MLRNGLIRKMVSKEVWRVLTYLLHKTKNRLVQICFYSKLKKNIIKAYYVEKQSSVGGL